MTIRGWDAFDLIVRWMVFAVVVGVCAGWLLVCGGAL